jgi:hypothetical protein
MARRLALGLLAALLLVAPVPVATPTAAQAPTPAAEVRLRAQTTWWTPEQPFTLALAVETTAPETLEVAVSVYGKLPTRIAFAASADGRTTGRPTETHVTPLADLPLDDDGDRVITFTPALRVDGVYPVRVDVRPLGGGNAVDGFVTHLVHVPAALEADELAVAAVVPVHAPPAARPDGTVAIDDRRAEGLADLADAFEVQAAVPLTLAPTPETVEALGLSPRDQDRATLTSLVQALPGRQLLGASYVPTNLTSMVNAGLGEETAGQLTRGTEVLRSRFGTEPTLTTRVIDERLSDDALAELQSVQSVTKLVVPESLLEPITRNTTLTGTFGMESRRGPVAAAMADTALAAHLDGDDPVLAGQHLLADLAQLYNDDPGVTRRGVVVAPGRGWEPDRELLETLLSQLAASPILEPVTIDRFFDGVAPAVSGTGSRATPLVRRIAALPEGAPAAPPLPGAAIRDARRRIDAFASAVDPASAPARAVLDRLDRTLLAVPSIDLRVRDRLRYLDGVDEQLDGELGKIEMPQDRSITLTAREGDIPVTITNRLGYPIRVALRVSGAPLEFPEGDVHDLELLRQNTTSQFAVRAPSSGSFPIRVQLLTPEGGERLAESRFTVRSTAISGVGTALSIGAGLFLVVWWGNHLRGRRSKKLVPA